MANRASRGRTSPRTRCSADGCGCAQPRRGHRVGHDAILLAAACPARAGDSVVDLGAGVGAAGLALAARVAGTTVTLVEIDPKLAALAARERAAQSAWRRACARSRSTSRRRRAPSPPPASPPTASTRVLMNPPFNDPARQRASPDAGAARWRMRRRGRVLAAWVKTAARLLRPRGTLTLIWRADGLADVLAALGAGLRRGRGDAGASGAGQAGDPHPRDRGQGEPGAARAAAAAGARRRVGTADRRSRCGAARRRGAGAGELTLTMT